MSASVLAALARAAAHGDSARARLMILLDRSDIPEDAMRHIATVLWDEEKLHGCLDEAVRQLHREGDTRLSRLSS